MIIYLPGFLPAEALGFIFSIMSSDSRNFARTAPVATSMLLPLAVSGLPEGNKKNRLLKVVNSGCDSEDGFLSQNQGPFEG